MDTLYDMMHEPPRVSHPVDIVIQRMADLNLDLEDLEILVQHVIACPKCRKVYQDQARLPRSRVA
jgi:hypothetical protein